MKSVAKVVFDKVHNCEVYRYHPSLPRYADDDMSKALNIVRSRMENAFRRLAVVNRLIWRDLNPDFDR